MSDDEDERLNPSKKKIKPRHDEMSDDKDERLYTNRVPGETEKSRQ
jgi:hypothetical protein